MIYFDNCSTTHKKPLCVLRAIHKGLTSLNYNPGRAGYGKAIKANIEVLNLRESACKLFNCPDTNNVIITKSCTESLNIALRSNIKVNGHIIATIYEHNSVLRTLEYLKQNHNVSYTLITPNINGQILVDDIVKNIKQNTYMVVTNHISNVTGSMQNIYKIGRLCKENNLFFVVDGAQSAGHATIDMEKMHINYLSIAGHKGVFGPQGVGLLLCNKATPKPLIYGGTGTYSSNITQPTDLPEGLEAGTMSMANILGLKAGINYTIKNFGKIHAKVEKITKYIYKELTKISNIKIYSPKDCVGVISFNLSNMSSNELSSELDKYNIATRSGLHCAPMVHQYYNTTNIGMTRIGISYFNTMNQAKTLIKRIKEINVKFNSY